MILQFKSTPVPSAAAVITIEALPVGDKLRVLWNAIRQTPTIQSEDAREALLDLVELIQDDVDTGSGDD